MGSVSTTASSLSSHATVGQNEPQTATDKPAREQNVDPEKQEQHQGRNAKGKVPHWRLVLSQTLITDAVKDYQYKGSGTEDDPYVVVYIPNDPRNPMEFSTIKKWVIVMTVGITTLAVAFVSSAYSGSIKEVMVRFDISQEVATLGIALFVLGFAVGPLLWARKSFPSPPYA